ncbi:MAG: chromosomal replication initiator protein DnaA [Solirubrobacteraceae bacterium]
MALPAHPDAIGAWRTIQGELRRLVGESTFEVWLAALELDSWDGAVLSLKAPPGTEAWISGRFRSIVEAASREVLGTAVTISLAGRSPDAPSPAQAALQIESEPAALHPRYRFEQFIIGEGNRLAHAAALAVAELPGQAYNPLFLHAPPGLGKTHLLHAIGNYVTAYGGGATVRYTTAEAFTNDFLSALHHKSLEPFKRAYRHVDVLLIDDIQFLASKARTEEEFFHTFNALHESGRQMVLTCDRLPRALVAIEERLRERFEAGLVADIQPPDHATRVAILRKRAELDQITLADPAVLELIADRVTDNVRSLEGALIRVVAFHSLIQKQIDMDLATQVLDTMYPNRGRRPPTIAEVQSIVAAHFKLSVEQLTSPSRTRRINWPRQVAIHLARDLTGESLPAIGKAFGGRNHATVLHACKRVSERLRDDQQTVDEISALATRATGGRADRDY